MKNASAMLAASSVFPAASVEPAGDESPLIREKQRRFRHLIVRGDEACWFRNQKGGYPFVDAAAETGATGLHAWGKAPKEEMNRYIAYCRERNITVHQGFGVGSYGNFDGEDPRDTVVRQKIKEKIASILESHDLDGIEFQTGEYDTKHAAASGGDTQWAQKLVDSLNPLIEYTLTLKDSLWIRTELLIKHFSEDDVLFVSKNLHPRCTVEWSEFTGPFQGRDAFEKGRALLAVDDRFSWFLKLVYYLYHHWCKEFGGRENPTKGKSRAQLMAAKEIPVPEMQPEVICAWADHWREWVKMLHEMKRTTLTICHCPATMPDKLSRLLAASVALARKPDLSNDQIRGLLGLKE